MASGSKRVEYQNAPSHSRPGLTHTLGIPNRCATSRNRGVETRRGHSSRFLLSLFVFFVPDKDMPIADAICSQRRKQVLTNQNIVIGRERPYDI